MNKINKIASIIAILLFAVSCLKDSGNYDYNYETVPSITIDTVGVSQQYYAILSSSAWAVGNHILFEPNIKYKNGDMNNLDYLWFALQLDEFQYKPIGEGHSSTYRQRDTLATTKALDYVVDLEPGKVYRVYLEVKDRTNRIYNYYQLSSYFVIPAASGNYYGVYCLQEKNGKVDIDVLRSPGALILGSGQDDNIYTTHNPIDPIEGTPKHLWWSTTGQWFYIVTDKEMRRIDPTGLQTMDKWDEGMFFEEPSVFSPEAFMNVNNCDFLINNGKMHVLYARIAGDRKFGSPILGNYQLYPFLSTETIASYSPVQGAIGAYQVVYDLSSNSYKSYFNKGTSFGTFNAVPGDAAFSVNAMKGTPLYIATLNGGETAAIMKRDDGSIWIDVAVFYNVVDNGYLSRQTKAVNLPEIENATHFCSGESGSAIWYSVGNKVYYYAYTTGQAKAEVLWQGDPNEEVTCMELLFTGGFPTSGRIFWIAAWNPTTNQGRVIEYEVNPSTGEGDLLYVPMFGGGNEQPRIYEGFGKIYGMTTRTQYN